MLAGYSRSPRPAVPGRVSPELFLAATGRLQQPNVQQSFASLPVAATLTARIAFGAERSLVDESPTDITARC
jgi:hypothetical protein